MDRQYLDIFRKNGFNFSRCFGSKSTYKRINPNHLVIFNARIYTKKVYLEQLKAVKDFFKGQKIEIWYGDLDLNKDIYNLYMAYLDIGEPLVITYEGGDKVIEIGRG